jgi:Na+/H+ antiporter NhaD/arsenite permease-like protein
MDTIILIIFIAGYFAITIEHLFKINKAAFALLTGVSCWTLYIFNSADKLKVVHQLTEHMGDLSGILFFLMCAMTLVEIMDSHLAFSVITDLISTNGKRKLLWIISLLCFFLSAVLDNLTTTIIMISIVSKIISDKNDRLLFGGMIIIAANAGGAWSPVGDVTTTMLWIGGKISASNIVIKTFLSSFVCLIVPLLWLTLSMRGNIERSVLPEKAELKTGPDSRQKLFFFAGIGVFLFVPVFKTITHLPPFIGILFGLGIMWVLTETIHKTGVEQKQKYSATDALRRIDMSTILFFLGILLAVASLQSLGLLNKMAGFLDHTIGNYNLVAVAIGILSAIVDNVPLVSGTIGMYDLVRFPIDHPFWELLAYCAGTGGSLLVIGSAAGVAAMGMMQINFFWYLKKIAPLALLGYFAGVAAYLLQQHLAG